MDLVKESEVTTQGLVLKSIPWVVIVGFVINIVAFAYMYGQMEARVSHLETQQTQVVEKLQSVPERLARVEVILQELRDNATLTPPMSFPREMPIGER